jgi:hypothetical protein
MAPGMIKRGVRSSRAGRDRRRALMIGQGPSSTRRNGVLAQDCRSGCAFARGPRTLGALVACILSARRCRRTEARNAVRRLGRRLRQRRNSVRQFGGALSAEKGALGDERPRSLLRDPERPPAAPSHISAGPRRPNPLLDCRRRSIVDVGRSVVGQALEIGPDQGFVGRWHAPALAAIELRG